MYQQPFNAQFSDSTRQFADAAARMNRIALQNVQAAFALQLNTLGENAEATFAYWNQLADVRDANELRDVIPAGVQVARENIERTVAAGQEIYERSLKAQEAIGQIGRGELEQVSAKVEAAAKRATKAASKA